MAGVPPARERPRLSQHFLRRGALAADIVARSTVGPRDLVLEVGAGAGALTGPLARRARHVLAVEIDPALAGWLRHEFAGEPRVEVIEADILDVLLPSEPYKVVGNIPFHLTADIVRRLTEESSPPDDALLIVQREAAQRFAGEPWAHESLRSLLLKPWWQVEVTRALRRTDFEPPPPVECALLWLARRPRALVEPREAGLYRDFVAHAFGRRGTSMRDALRGLFTPPQSARLASELRFDLRARPSDLDFPRWLALFRALTLLAPDARRLVRGGVARLPR